MLTDPTTQRMATSSSAVARRASRSRRSISVTRCPRDRRRRCSGWAATPSVPRRRPARHGWSSPAPAATLRSSTRPWLGTAIAAMRAASGGSPGRRRVDVVTKSHSAAGRRGRCGARQPFRGGRQQPWPSGQQRGRSSRVPLDRDVASAQRARRRALDPLGDHRYQRSLPRHRMPGSDRGRSRRTRRPGDGEHGTRAGMAVPRPRSATRTSSTAARDHRGGAVAPTRRRRRPARVRPRAGRQRERGRPIAGDTAATSVWRRSKTCLVHDDTNPRSLVFQLDRINEHLAALPWNPDASKHRRFLEAAARGRIGEGPDSLAKFVLDVRGPLAGADPRADAGLVHPSGTSWSGGFA